MSNYIKLDGYTKMFKIVPELYSGSCSGCCAQNNVALCDILNSDPGCSSERNIFEQVDIIDTAPEKQDTLSLTPEIIAAVLDIYIQPEVIGWFKDVSKNRRKKICDQIIAIHNKENNPEYKEFLRLKEKFGDGE